MKLVVGLGNPGPRYALSRHNVGFRVVDHLARSRGVALDEERFYGRYGVGWLDSEEREPLALLEPATFMNLSGRSVAAAVEHLARTRDLDVERDVLVVYDDLDLPVARLRLRPAGGPGGHNGMVSVIDCLGTRSFSRLRFGIGRPPVGVAVLDHVLQRFTEDEERTVGPRVSTAALAAATALREGMPVAMDRFNGEVEV